MNTSSLNEIYTRITVLLAQKGMSGTEFAPILGLKKSPLTDWKNGKSAPTLEHIITICDFFGVSAEYIIWGKNPEQNIIPALSKDDLELLELYHQLSERDQGQCVGFIKGLIKKEPNNETAPEKKALGK